MRSIIEDGQVRALNEVKQLFKWSGRRLADWTPPFITAALFCASLSPDVKVKTYEKGIGSCKLLWDNGNKEISALFYDDYDPAVIKPVNKLYAKERLPIYIPIYLGMDRFNYTMREGTELIQDMLTDSNVYISSTLRNARAANQSLRRDIFDCPMFLAADYLPRVDLSRYFLCNGITAQMFLAAQYIVEYLRLPVGLTVSLEDTDFEKIRPEYCKRHTEHAFDEYNEYAKKFKHNDRFCNLSLIIRFAVLTLENGTTVKKDFDIRIAEKNISLFIEGDEVLSSYSTSEFMDGLKSILADALPDCEGFFVPDEFRWSYLLPKRDSDYGKKREDIESSSKMDRINKFRSCLAARRLDDFLNNAEEGKSCITLHSSIMPPTPPESPSVVEEPSEASTPVITPDMSLTEKLRLIVGSQVDKHKETQTTSVFNNN